jgi:hypothetical protein
MSDFLKFMKKLFLITSIITVLTGPVLGYEWEIIGRMPIPVKGAQAIAQNSLIYILGGYSDSLYSDLNLIQVFNPKTGEWQVLDDTLSMPRYGHSAQKYGENIVYFGGALNTLPDYQSLEFWNITSPPYFYNYNPNFSRNFSTSQIYQDDLYIFGGYNNLLPSDTSTVPYMVRYNIPSGNITNKDMAFYNEESIPIHQMSAIIPPDIYLLGGSSFGINRDIIKFNIDAQDWLQFQTTLIEERAGGQAVKIDDQTVALIGGYNESSAALNSVETIHFWYEDYFYNDMAASMNFERSELAAVKLDSFVYVFGGCDQNGNCIAEVEKWLPETAATDITQSDIELPNGFQLLQNYPNPFNSSTIIPVILDKFYKLRIDIFSINGSLIKCVSDGPLNAGTYSFHWDGKNSKRQDVPSGVYFYRLVLDGNQVAVKRMLLVR